MIKDGDSERIEIARKIAADLFFRRSQNPARDAANELLNRRIKEAQQKEKRFRSTLKLIGDHQSNALYSMKTELRFITERNIEKLQNELANLANKENIKFSSLVEVINGHMQMALFGCSIDIGICTDSTTNVIEFFGDSNYRRRVKRGESNCFTAIDQNEIVVEVIAKSKRKNPLVTFAEGDYVVYVPIFGTSSAQGVMEIYGLQTTTSNSNAVADRSVYYRPQHILKAMIAAKDYKFVNTVRLWKKPPTSPKTYDDGRVGKYYGVNAFIVAGMVTDVSHGRRGVPYYGGPRYTVTWENGEIDEEVTASDLLLIYRESPQSLGCSNSLDEYMTEKLYEISSAAGRMIEAQRIRTFLIELRQRMQQMNKSRFQAIADIGIEAIASMIHGVQEIAFVGYTNAATKAAISAEEGKDDDEEDEKVRATAISSDEQQQLEGPNSSHSAIESGAKTFSDNNSSSSSIAAAAQTTNIVEYSYDRQLHLHPSKKEVHIFDQSIPNIIEMIITSESGNTATSSLVGVESGGGGGDINDVVGGDASTISATVHFEDSIVSAIGSDSGDAIDYDDAIANNNNSHILMKNDEALNSNNNLDMKNKDKYNSFESGGVNNSSNNNSGGSPNSRRRRSNMKSAFRKRYLSFVCPDKYNSEWIAMELKVADGFVWSKKVNFDRYFVVLNREFVFNSSNTGSGHNHSSSSNSKNNNNYPSSPLAAAQTSLTSVATNNASALDIQVFEHVMFEISSACEAIWTKEIQRQSRRDLLKEIEVKMYDWRHDSIHELCFNALQCTATHLPGANVYIGMLLPGGSIISYVACSNHSRMEGKQLQQGEGVSFDVINDLNTVILRAEDLDKNRLLIKGSLVDVYYGKKLYKAKIHKVRGHEKFDIWFECDRKVEAGVDISRIIPRNTAFRMKKFGKAELPFVCVALRHRSKAIGVIGIDTLSKIPKAAHEVHPEADLLLFLEQLGKLLGTNIDTQRKKASLQTLYSVAKNQFTEVRDVLEATFEAIYTNLTHVKGLLASRFVYEDSEPKPERGLRVLLSRGIVPPDVLQRLKAFNIARSNLKPLQKFPGDKVAWLLCKLRPASRGMQSKVYFITIVSSAPIKDPDYEFLTTLQKLIAGTLQNIVSHKAVTEVRYEALKEVRYICEHWREYANQRALFLSIVDCVQSCFYSANMYVGLLSPYNKTIEYILESTNSNMAGKSLSRDDKKGVTFQLVVDTAQPTYVTSINPNAAKLQHFGPRQLFEFPYVCIPIIAHIDAMIGVLGIDHCEDPSASSENLDDTVSFFASVGTYLSQAVRGFKDQDAKARLRQLAYECNTHSDGIRSVKKILLDLLPFAKRIVEVVYEPREASSVFTAAGMFQAAMMLEGSGGVGKTLSSSLMIGDMSREPPTVMTVTPEDYVVIIQIQDAVCLSPMIKNAVFGCLWQGAVVHSSKVPASTKGNAEIVSIPVLATANIPTNTSVEELQEPVSSSSDPFLICIPKGIHLDFVYLQLVLNGCIDHGEKELARKALSLVYLMNAPLYVMEHYLDSHSLSNARVAKVEILSKMYSANHIVGFVITGVQVKGITYAYDAYHRSSGSSTSSMLSKSLFGSQHKGSSTKSRSSTDFADAASTTSSKGTNKQQHHSNHNLLLPRQASNKSLGSMHSTGSGPAPLGDIFTVLRWNGEEVARTKTLSPTSDLLWSGLNVYLRLESSALKNNLFELDVRDDQSSNGGVGTAYGRIALDGNDLKHCYSSSSGICNSSWIDLKPLTADGAIEESDASTVDGGSSAAVLTIVSTKGVVRLKGQVIMAGNMSTVQMKEEINQGLITKEKQLLMMGGGGASKSGKGVQYYTCELGVIRARELGRSELWGANIRGPDVYAVVSFNGEEVGRTRVISNTTNPCWGGIGGGGGSSSSSSSSRNAVVRASHRTEFDAERDENDDEEEEEDEVFSIRVPGGDELELCALQIELFHMKRQINDTNGTYRDDDINDSSVAMLDQSIGSVEITGKTLTNFLASNKLKRQWFDLQDTNSYDNNNIDNIAADIGDAIATTTTLSAVDINSSVVAVAPRRNRNMIPIQGELMLSGRPHSVLLTGQEELAKELGHMELSLISFTNLKPLPLPGHHSQYSELVSEEEVASPSYRKKQQQQLDAIKKEYELLRTYAIVYFNGRKIHTTKYAEVSSSSYSEGEWAQQQQRYKERVLFRYPNSKTLFQCQVKIEIWQVKLTHRAAAAGGSKYISSGTIKPSLTGTMTTTTNTTTTVNGGEEGNLVGVIQLTGSALTKLFGQKGLITKWIPIVQPHITTGSTSAATAVDPAEIRLRGGPAGTMDIFEERDGEELWFDILAATRLPHRKISAATQVGNNSALTTISSSHASSSSANNTGSGNGSTILAAEAVVTVDDRPNVYCEVSWNRKKIGRTTTIVKSCNPIWDRQRFCLRVPIITENITDHVLAHCQLRVDLYDKQLQSGSAARGTYLGHVIITNNDVQNFFNQPTAQVKWFPVHLPQKSSGRDVGGGRGGIATRNRIQEEEEEEEGRDDEDERRREEAEKARMKKKQEKETDETEDEEEEDDDDDDNGNVKMRCEIKFRGGFAGVKEAVHVFNASNSNSNNNSNSSSAQASTNVSTKIPIVTSRASMKLNNFLISNNPNLNISPLNSGEEYLLEILSARGLSNTDIFGGSDAYVTVEWRGREIGRTQIVPNSVNPKFLCETFIIKDNSDMKSTAATAPASNEGSSVNSFSSSKHPYQLSNQYPSHHQARSLSLQVWSRQLTAAAGNDGSNRTRNSTKTRSSVSVFLGRVYLIGESLDNLFSGGNNNNNSNNSKEYTLTTSDEYTFEENLLVRGHLTITCKPILNSQQDAIPPRDATLYIVSASNLPSSNAFGIDSDIYCKVYRKNDKERGGEESEIFQGGVAYKTLNPTFPEELISILIPAVDDDEDEWLGYTVRIEVWDSTGEILGMLVLSGLEARKLLTRTSSNTVLQHVSYNLTPATTAVLASSSSSMNYSSTMNTKTVSTANRDDSKQVSSITLCGGLQTEFAAQWTVLKEKERAAAALLLTKAALPQIREKSMSSSFNLGNFGGSDDDGDEDDDEGSINSGKPFGDDAVITLLTMSHVASFARRFCIVYWNKVELGRSSTVEANEQYDIDWSKQTFNMKLARDNVMTDCILRIEIYNVDKKELSSLFGSIELTAQDLVQLFSPSVHQLGFSVILAGNRAGPNRKSNSGQESELMLSGEIPRLRREYEELHADNDDAASVETAATPIAMTAEKNAVNSAEMIELQPCLLEIRLLSASNLARVSRIMSRSTDAYATIYWGNDDTEPIGKTEPVPNTVNPAFKQLFTVKKGKGAKYKECRLRLSLYCKNYLSSPTFLGEVVLTGEKMAAWITSQASKSFALTKSATIAGKQNFVQGEVELSVKIVTDIVSSSLFNKELPLPSHLLEMEVVVLAARSLMKSGGPLLSAATGGHNPHTYCTLKLGRAELGQTAVVDDTVDPMWEDNQSFVFRIPKSWWINHRKKKKAAAVNAASTSPKAGKNDGDTDEAERGDTIASFIVNRPPAAAGSKGGMGLLAAAAASAAVNTGGIGIGKKPFLPNSDLNRLLMSGAGINQTPPEDSDAVTEQDLKQIAGINLSELVLTVSLYDCIQSGEDIFMGCVELRGDTLRKFIISVNPLYSSKWFPLQQPQEADLTVRKNVSKRISAQAQVQLLLCRTPKTVAGDFEGKDIELVICAARDLQTRKECAYQLETVVKFRWNGRNIAKTYSAKQGISPEWEDERFHIRLPGGVAIEDCILELEVWQAQQQQQITPPPKLLLMGMMTLTGKDLKDLVEKSHFAPVWYPVSSRAVAKRVPPSLLMPSMTNSSTPNAILNSFRSVSLSAQPEAMNAQLQIRCGYYDAATGGGKFSAGALLRYELTIYSAKDVGKADSTTNSSDPYAICKWNGREIGRTPHLQRTVNPVWESTKKGSKQLQQQQQQQQMQQLLLQSNLPKPQHKFLILIDPEEDMASNTLQIELWHHRVVSKGDFLGGVYFTGEKLSDLLLGSAASSGGAVSSNSSTSTANSSNSHVGKYYFPLEKNPAMEEDRQQLIRGKIEFGLRLTGGDENVGVGGKPSLKSGLGMHWSELCDTEAGLPLVQLQLISVQHLPVLTSSASAAAAAETAAINAAPTQRGLFAAARKLAVGSSRRQQQHNNNNNNNNNNTEATASTSALKHSNNKHKPVCTISWVGEEVADTPQAVSGAELLALSSDDDSGNDISSSNNSNTANYKGFEELLSTSTDPNAVYWRSDNKFHLHVPGHIDKVSKKSLLLLQIWDYSTGKKGGCLGKVELSFSSLWRLYCGEFTFPLQEPDNSRGKTIDGKNKHKTSSSGHGASTTDNMMPVRRQQQKGVIRGSVTFRLEFVFPFWDSVRSIVPRTYLRKISIYGATNLPLVNGIAPNTKCVATIFTGSGGSSGMKARTIVVYANNSPVWPRVDVEIIVDADTPIQVAIVVYHVNSSDKKEVILGQEMVPFEYLLRPPQQVFNLFLGPAPKRSTPGYRFTTSGSVKLRIRGINNLGSNMLPYTGQRLLNNSEYNNNLNSSSSSDTIRNSRSNEDIENNVSNIGNIPIKLNPAETLLAKEVRNLHHTTQQQPQLIKTDLALTGDPLSPDERLWLGTACDFIHPQLIASKPEWIVLPVQDIGLQLGLRKADLVGTRPGHRLTLCIEREAGKVNVSDVMVVQDVVHAVSECLTQLRKKDIFRTMREKVLHNLALFVSDIMTQSKFEIKSVMHLIYEAISICFPGTRVRTATISQDFQSLFYTSYDIFGESVRPSHTTLHAKQGCDWDAMGRCISKSIVIKSYADCQSLSPMPVVLFKPFALCRLPRFTVPMRSGDCAVGFFQVEEFDIHTGGMTSSSVNNNRSSYDNAAGNGGNTAAGGFSDEIEVKKWFEDIGDICGEAMYSAQENRVLAKVEDYCSCWNSSANGLISELLKDTLEVVRGCKLIEVLKIDADYNIKSLLARKPTGITMSGNEVVFTSIRFVMRQAATTAVIEKVSNRNSALKFVGSALKDLFSSTLNRTSAIVAATSSTSAVAVAASTEADAESDIADNSSTGAAGDEKAAASEVPRMLACVRYGAIEQMHVATYDETTQSFVTSATTLLLGRNRILHISLYEVDEGLNILAEYIGKATFLSFEEDEMKCALAAPVPIDSTVLNLPAFDATIAVHWPRPYDFEANTKGNSNNSGAAEDEAEDDGDPFLKGFSITIHRARELLALDIGGTLDPFCEVIYGGKLISQTAVQKQTRLPIWDETITVPYKGAPSSVYIEIYDMSFLRKGSLLGVVELPHQQLVSGSGGLEIEYPLQQKKDMNTKKQLRVGGFVTITFGPEVPASVLAAKAAAAAAASGAPAEKDAVNLFEIPQAVWTMQNPSIQLTLQSAKELAKANTFGGSSDAFVMIFLGSSSSSKINNTSSSGSDTSAAGIIAAAVREDKVADTNNNCIEQSKVYDNSLNPEWDQTFTINLGVALEKGTTTLSDFPIIRLEVYNYNKVKPADFLGTCEIPPSAYLHSTKGNYQLLPLPNKKTRLVKGNIQVGFVVVDNVIGINKRTYTVDPITRSLQPLIYAEVHVIKASNLMKAKANRMGQSDPYVRLRWNYDICGETSYKKDTLNPQWNNEKFLVALSEAGTAVGDMILEVWDKDFFKEGDFMGEAVISSEELLHPSTTAGGVITLNLQPRQGSSTIGGDATTSITDGSSKARRSGNSTMIQGTVTIKLLTRVVRQHPQCDRKEAFEWAMPVPESFESPANVMSLIMAYDPIEEAARQTRENTKYPSIIEQTTAQMNKYLNRPFERTGLISEMHYGQLTAASRRGEQTVLKTPYVDMVCIPAYDKNAIKKKLAAADGNVVTTATAATTVTKEMERQLLQQFSEQCLYLVARFEHNKLSRRDLRFASKLHGSIVSGLAAMNSRDEKMVVLHSLEGHLTALSKATDNPAGTIVQGLLEMEVALGCAVKLYLLDTDGISLLKCSVETGIVDPDTPPADTLIHLAAQLSRHAIILQRYRGQVSVIDMQWESFNQLNLPTLISLKDTFNEIEGHNIVQKFQSLSEQQVKGGVMYLPLIAHGELFLGIIALSGVDKFPSAQYRIDTAAMATAAAKDVGSTGNSTANVTSSISSSKSKTDKVTATTSVKTTKSGTSADNNHNNNHTTTVNRNKEHSSSGNVGEDGDEEDESEVTVSYAVLDKMQHGFANCLKTSCTLFADGVYSSRLGNVYRKIRSFPVKHDTNPLLVIRYAFRLLVTALPAIRGISIWAVDIERELAIRRKRSEKIVQRRGIFAKLFGFGRDYYKNNRKAASDNTVSDAVTNIVVPTSPSNVVADRLGAVADELSDKFGQQQDQLCPAVLAGCFGLEDPKHLLATAIERKPANKGSGLLHSRSLKKRSSKVNGASSHQEMIETLQKQTHERLAAWRIDVPISLQEATTTRTSLSNAAVVSGGVSVVGSLMRLPGLNEDEEEDSSCGIGSSSVDSNSITSFSRNAVGTAASGSGVISKRKTKFSPAAMQTVNLVHAETVRCVKTLQMTTFRVITGHTLSLLGNSEATEGLLCKLFRLEDQVCYTTADTNPTSTNPVGLVPVPPAATTGVLSPSLSLSVSSSSASTSSSMPPVLMGSNSSDGGNSRSSSNSMRPPPPTSSRPSIASPPPQPNTSSLVPGAVAPRGGRGTGNITRRPTVTTTPNGTIITGAAVGRNPLLQQSRRPPTYKAPPPPTAAAGVPTTALYQPPPIPVEETAVAKKPRFKYFISSATHGVGGDTGWGIIGEAVEKTLTTIAELLDAKLGKLLVAQVVAAAKEEVIASASRKAAADKLALGLAPEAADSSLELLLGGGSTSLENSVRSSNNMDSTTSSNHSGSVAAANNNNTANHGQSSSRPSAGGGGIAMISSPTAAGSSHAKRHIASAVSSSSNLRNNGDDDDDTLSSLGDEEEEDNNNEDSEEEEEEEEDI